MALQKQGVNFNFGQGLDTKTDPNQVPAGQMLELDNTQFDKGGLLSKRNGFGNLTVLPNLDSTTLSTLNDTLLATGGQLQAYSPELGKWLPQGTPLPLDVNTLALARSSLNQTKVDAAYASNGSICAVYYEGTQAYYQISDASSGQSILAPVPLPATATSVRVYTVGVYFFITFLATVSATPHLQYIAVPIQTPDTPTAPADISTQVSSLNAGYDGVVLQNNLYLVWDGSAGDVRIGFITSSLVLSSNIVVLANTANLAATAVDKMAGIIYYAWHKTGDNFITVTARDPQLNLILTPTSVPFTDTALNKLTGVAANGSASFFAQITNTVSQLNAQRYDYIRGSTITQTGAITSLGIIIRQLGLASKPVFIEDNIYMLTVFNGPFQPTYFLMDITGKIISKLAYSNGGGYVTGQVLPSMTVVDREILVPYLYKVLVDAVNKSQNAPSNAGVYSQTGINLASFNFDSVQLTSEIAKSLHLTGGVMWQYDGVNTVEQGFNLWPENMSVTTATTGGLLTAQVYYYQAIYEWTDAGGNLNRSAPNIPVKITTTGSTSANTINVPTITVTDKEKVRILIYRWSTAQQSYYQVTSIAAPLINDESVDYITFVDTQADSAIVGNSLIYTTGGVIENISANPSSSVAIFKNRMWYVDAEDRNVIGYSKPIVPNVPVEFSDLFKLYIAPTTGAQGSTGPITAVYAMDDKLIIFKSDAIYYLVGNGPDNTGSQNDYSDPVFVTSTVGCENARSIVNTPNGLMFQSDKGIWRLNRDLSTEYIGAPVERFNSDVVVSALLIPGTNQVRFTLIGGKVLVYDYYFQQWGTFSGIAALSACLYEGKHTYINRFGQVRQETPGKYIDGTAPVLISFTTAWLKMTGLQGFQRAYQVFLLSNYLTPHKLSVNIAYDFNPAPLQTSTIEPTNFSPAWGDLVNWGAGEVWGGPSDVEQWRIFLTKQKCQAIQISVSEIYDPNFGVAAGAGLTMSGINLLVGGKLSYPKPPHSGSVG